MAHLFTRLTERLTQRLAPRGQRPDQRGGMRQAGHPLNEAGARHGDDGTGFAKPPGTDWVWRPGVWRGALPQPGAASVASGTRLGTELALYHDCPLAELTLRQIRNRQETAPAPFGVQMEVFGFAGSYLSWAIDLPEEAVRGLTRDHILRFDAHVEPERPMALFARLTIRHGPNTAQMVQELQGTGAEARAEFDLAYLQINAQRLGQAWVDLLFEAPGTNRVVLRDLTCSRRLRAPL